MTGVFGVGGGFLIVPTLAIALALSMRLAIGTSLMVITATSTMALIAHLAAGRALDLGVTTATTGACVAGGSPACTFWDDFRNACSRPALPRSWSPLRPTSSPPSRSSTVLPEARESALCLDGKVAGGGGGSSNAVRGG